MAPRGGKRGCWWAQKARCRRRRRELSDRIWESGLWDLVVQRWCGLKWANPNEDFDALAAAS